MQPDHAAGALLEAAANVYDGLDWSQFRVALDARGHPRADATEDGVCAVCMLGAVAIAASFHDDPMDDTVANAVRWLRDALSSDDLIGWNRDRGQSREHVQATLRRAARHAHRGGWTNIGHVPDTSDPPELHPAREGTSTHQHRRRTRA